MIIMRKYTAKDEEGLINQIESDTELDLELEKQGLVKGHVVEIRYSGKAQGNLRLLERDRLPFIYDITFSRTATSSFSLSLPGLVVEIAG